MSLSELKEQAAALPLAEQRELSAFLEYLLEQRPETEAADIARKIDDRKPENWLSWEAVKRDFSR